MEQGDVALLTLLDAAGFQLSPSRVAQLGKHVEKKLDELFGSHKEYLLHHAHKLGTLAWLRQAYEILQLSAEPFARYDAWQAERNGTQRLRGVNPNPWTKA